MVQVATQVDEVYAGDDWFFKFRHGTRATPSDPIVFTDLSGWTITAMWRPKDAKGAPAITLTVDMSQAADGWVTIHADQDQTRAMAGAGVFDVQGQIGSLDKTFVRGTTKWRLDVTRSG